MPDPSMWRSDLVIVNAAVVHPEQVIVEMSNRGSAASNQFTVTVSERIGETSEVRGTLAIESMTNLGSQTITVDLNKAVSSDVLISIDYPNQELFECLPSNQRVALKHFRVKATQANGLTDTQNFWVPVVNNQLEVLNEMPVKVYEGGNYIYRPEVAGGTGHYSYSISQGPSSASFNEKNELVWLVEQGSEGEHFIEIAVQDEQGEIATKSINVNVLPAITNEKPVVLSTPPLDAVIGQEYHYQLVVEEPDGEAMTLHTEVGQIDENNVFTWTPTMADYNWYLGRGGYRPIVVEISDINDALTIHNWGINLHLPSEYQNAPIVFDLHSSSVKVGRPLDYRVVASNPLEGPLTFELVNPPTGMTIASSGRVQWQPDEPQIGYHIVRVLVSNTEASNYADIGINVEPLIGIISQPNLFAPVAALYQYQLESTLTEVSYRLANAPNGMTISNTGLISWIPSVADIGAHDVLVHALDNTDDVSTQQFRLNVFDNVVTNNPPVITSDPPGTSVVGEQYSYRVTAQDVENDVLSYSLETAPIGMTIDAAQGLISWTPNATQVGVHAVTVAVSDAQLNAVTQSFSLLTTDAPIIIDDLGSTQANLGLINQPKTEAFVGQNYWYRAAGFSDQGGPVAVSLVEGPEGMTITPNKPFEGYFELAWTPDEANCQHDVVLELSDGLGATEQITYTLDVYSAPKRQNRFQCSVDAEFCATR